MREESHLDDMRAAIRGDFERLEERRGEQELMRVEEPEAGEAAEAPEPAQLEPEQPAPEPGPAPEPSEPEPEPEPAPESEEDDEPEPAPRRSWVDRLLGR